MMLCVAGLVFAASGFTLEWQHSVARTIWWERWEVTDAGLAPVEARITGAGAGMEPPPDARRLADGWHWTPQVSPQPQVLLAASGATGGGWRLCAGGRCHDLPETGAPLRLSLCDPAGRSAADFTMLQR